MYKISLAEKVPTRVKTPPLKSCIFKMQRRCSFLTKMQLFKGGNSGTSIKTQTWEEDGDSDRCLSESVFLCDQLKIPRCTGGNALTIPAPTLSIVTACCQHVTWMVQSVQLQRLLLLRHLHIKTPRLNFFPDLKDDSAVEPHKMHVLCFRNCVWSEICLLVVAAPCTRNDYLF
jgi:hypothetical protein